MSWNHLTEVQKRIEMGAQVGNGAKRQPPECVFSSWDRTCTAEVVRELCKTPQLLGGVGYVWRTFFFFFENPHRRGQIDLKRSCFRLVCFSSAGFDKKSTPPHTFLLCPHTQNIFRHQQTKPTSFGKYSSVCTRIFVSLCCFFPTRCCSIRRVETLRPLRVHSPDKSIQNPKGGKKWR